MFSNGFSYEPRHLLPQNRIDVSHEASVIFQHISQNAMPGHGICTLSPLDAALTIRFAKTRNTTRLITSKVLGLLRKMTMEVAKVLRLPRKLQRSAMHFLKTTQKYCACHTKPLSTSYETHLNVTKCHPCHAKRSNATLETSKSDPRCRTYNRHRLYGPHTDTCGRLLRVAQRRANTPSTPRPPE